MGGELVKSFSLYLRCGKVESGPPLSTILGNLGINTTKFVKEFNEYTKDLPDYFLLVIVINVYNDKTYSFNIMEPSVSSLLRWVCFEQDFLVKGSGGYRPFKFKVVSVKDIIMISFFKFGICNENTLKLIYGTITAMDVFIVKNANRE